MNLHKFSGAWLTDIDDTLIESGKTPDDVWIKGLAEKIRVLKENNILWIPMSGVALVKLGPRILYRLPEDVLSHVMYYGGDGSQKYFYSEEKSEWMEDEKFISIFSDAQGIAVLGLAEYRKALIDIYADSDSASLMIEKRLQTGRENLKKYGYSPEYGILDTLKEMLQEKGYDPAKSEIYYRGGSVSWMIFGDISAEPYREKKARQVRSEIMDVAENWLAEYDGLADLGERPISVPFPGARGIKFVLIGNDKEKATRNIIDTEGVVPETIFFTGNEIFDGGNDNMIRNVDGVTLLSVGEQTDEGVNVIRGGLGVEANRKWMELICDRLQKGEKWPDILSDLKAYAGKDALQSISL
ncbi:MAG: hypothetical protein JEY99_07900 [Spirochaetales bacterium]|nr:hypothetical protein [Spirochaetales bacterium]